MLRPLAGKIPTTLSSPPHYTDGTCSNLAVANHVIFVAPYHTKGSNAQYIYEAATTQAVGRARRYGQQKTVHVYHFLVKGTADIDITELRNSKVVKLAESGEAELVCADREQSKLGTSFYEHISRECE
jgi:pyocin large subunit-like protein